MMADFPDVEMLPVEETRETRVTVAEGYDVCLACGKTLKVTASGALRKHRCMSGETSESVTTVTESKTARPARRRSRTVAPDKVRRLAVAVIGEGVEWTTDQVLSRATDLPTSQIPSDLPDADAMIGPFVNLLWPQIPKGAQKALTELADHEDLIGACFAWFEWGQQLKAFTEEVNRSRREDENGGNGQVSSEVAGVTAGDFDLGVRTYPAAIPPL